MYSQSFISYLAQAYEQYRADRAASAEGATPRPQQHSRLRRFLQWLTPNGGTLLLALILILTQGVWAQQMTAPSANSITTIPYQGRLADINGDPVTGRINMEFRLYDTPTGGSPLWEEFWTGGNAVNVSDGLFSVMLGSINPSLVNVVQGHDELYLGITVGTDSEMEPRVQLGSVPFSVWSLTVADDSITADKIAPGAVGSDEIATGAVGSDEIATNAVGRDEIATDAVSSDEIAHDAVGSDEIATDAVGSDEIATNAVGSDEIANGAVTSAKMSPTFFQASVNDDVAFSEGWYVVLDMEVNFPIDANYLVIATVVTKTDDADKRILVRLQDENSEYFGGQLMNTHPVGGIGGSQTGAIVAVHQFSAGSHHIKLVAAVSSDTTGYVRSGTQLVAIPFSSP